MLEDYIRASLVYILEHPLPYSLFEGRIFGHILVTYWSHGGKASNNLACALQS